MGTRVFAVVCDDGQAWYLVRWVEEHFDFFFMKAETRAGSS